ncbi:hypothetical protein AN642_02110 [Epulopiscium sp. SCG-B10WGA-EpuloA2]|nr:hypothetical protein AN642_02110 [Epulopiscium sp. SCG-B10WGA-EpuloA2]
MLPILNENNLFIIFAIDAPLTKFMYLKTIFNTSTISEVKNKIKVYPSSDLEVILNTLMKRFDFAQPNTEIYSVKGQLLQKFIFKPKTPNTYRKYLDELECYFFKVDGGIEMVMKMDKRGRNFKTVLKEVSIKDKNYKTIFITPYDIVGTLEKYLTK